MLMQISVIENSTPTVLFLFLSARMIVHKTKSVIYFRLETKIGFWHCQ